MSDKTELERILEFGISGVPQIKADEKRIWLGEFRERVILGLTIEQAMMMEAFSVVKRFLKDPKSEILIVNNNIPMDIARNYMVLAREMDKEYKSMATDAKDAMGLVIVSRSPVQYEDVLVDIKPIPEKFKNLTSKNLCGDCYDELVEINPDIAKEYKRVGFFGKLIGIPCNSCEK